MNVKTWPSLIWHAPGRMWAAMQVDLARLYARSESERDRRR